MINQNSVRLNQNRNLVFSNNKLIFLKPNATIFQHKESDDLSFQIFLLKPKSKNVFDIRIKTDNLN